METTSTSSGSSTSAMASSGIDGDGTTAGTGDGTTVEVDPGTSTGEASGGSTSNASTGNEPTSTSTGAVSDSSSGGPPATCDEIFGTASGYLLCWEDEVSCGFNVDPGGQTCTAVCGLFGATCIDSVDNPGAGQECVVQGKADCNSNLGEASTICVCAK